VSAEGLGVTEAADTLGLSPEAARRLLASAVTKLGARSKLEAVIIALREGLIDPLEP
jgi:DNA-binding CsgD family transcriptional regulator